MTRDELDATLKMLRARGVSKYTDTPGEGFTVEFFPVQPEPDATKPTNDPEKCACGHSLPVQHMNGFCVEGCSAEECNPVPK